ncbi:MAG: IPT/TIG domain-containing protein [Nitrospirales bacterium]
MRYLIVRLLTVLLTAVVVFFPTAMQAGEAEYAYDALGRLTTVVDETGETAIYVYDAVGNLLRIDRHTPGGSGIDIFALLPDKGAVGSAVKIQGYGFSATSQDNTVEFNGTAATVVSATAYAIVAEVPSGATTGTVEVTNTNGAATSPEAFTVLGAPTITGITPETVAQGGTWPVTIAGTHLAQATAVTFTQAGLTATILTGVTETSLPLALAVAGTVPPGDYTFDVETPLGTAGSGTVTISVAAPTGAFVHATSHVSVWVPRGVPTGPSMTAPAGTSTFPIAAERAPTGAGLAVNPASAFFSHPAAVAPTGSTMTVAPPVSAFVPHPAAVAPTGSTMTVAPPVSEVLP